MNFKEQLVESINKSNIRVNEISGSLLEERLSNLSYKFTSSKDGFPLWMNLSKKVAVVNQSAWSWLEDLLEDSEVMMIYDSDTEKFCFVFQKGGDLQHAFAECLPNIKKEFYFYSIYVTNKQLDYLLCLNHTDTIYASGDAISRIGKYNNITYNLGLRSLRNVFSILDIDQQDLNTQKKQSIVKQLVFKFGDNKISSPLWEGMISRASAFDFNDSFHLLEQFIGKNKVVVFFEEEEDDIGFIFNSAQELQKYLNVAPWGEIYITNEQTEYLICINEYSKLLTWGSADAWFNQFHNN